MDSFARTGKSNRVLPAYQEVRLKAKRRAVSADLSLAKRAAASRITRHFGTTAIPATVSVPLSFIFTQCAALLAVLVRTAHNTFSSGSSITSVTPC